MSTLTDNELDLEKLFLPAWAQETPSAQRFAKYTGNEGEPRGRENRREAGERPRRRDAGGPGGGGFSSGGNRGADKRSGERPRSGQRPGGSRRDSFAARRQDRFQAPAPLPEININLLPEDNGADSLARQVKSTGRAYPLFGIASLVLQKPERYVIKFSVKKKAEGQVAQPLFLCALDDSLWLSDDEAIAHVLNKHFSTFYQTERTATEPPKGVYTFVAQCGMSGVILGPPNIHDYQIKLRKLHAERFSRMPFETFKARVKIVKDEAVVKKWIEEQSFKTEYSVLNVPEPLKLASMEEVEKHFRTVHKDNIIKPVESHTLGGIAARGLRSRELVRAMRVIVEDQHRFPMQIATALSQRFASNGLHFFKVNKTVTHVCVARPTFLDLEATPVSENIKKVVEFINAHPKTTRRKLFEALAPAPPVAIVPATQDATAETPTAFIHAEPTADQTAVNADLHWLIHQGHVIEFADGRLETAKKPLPKPPKPEKKPEKPADQGETKTASAGEPVDQQATPTMEIPSAPAAVNEPEVVSAPPLEAAAEAPDPTEPVAPAAISDTPTVDSTTEEKI